MTLEPASLILTATVQPGSDVYVLERADWESRLSDYLQSIARWQSAAPAICSTIYIAENSKVLNDQVEASLCAGQGKGDVSVQLLRLPDDGPVESPVQKGRAEARLLDQAIAMLDHAGARRFIKCSGRLFVRNTAAVIGQAVDNDLVVSMSSKLNHADTRFFSMSVDTWLRHYSEMAPEIDEISGYYMEHVFAKRTLRAVASGERFVGVRRLPSYAGVSGSTGGRYDTWASVVRRRVHEATRLPHRVRGITL